MIAFSSDTGRATFHLMVKKLSKSPPHQHASEGGWSAIRTPIEFRKIEPARLKGKSRRTWGAARLLWRNAAQPGAMSHHGRFGFPGISPRASYDANSTQEANKHMPAELRQHRAELELAALYRRREAVSALIRSIEHYQRAKVRWVQKCSRRGSRAAA